LEPGNRTGPGHWRGLAMDKRHLGGKGEKLPTPPLHKSAAVGSRAG